MPTNATAHRYAVHRWYNFIAGFAPEFVAQYVPASPNALLLDPFAGCATALVVAQSLGHRAIGFEPHPFFVRIARAKTAPPPTTARLCAIKSALLDGIAEPTPPVRLAPSAETFLNKLFEEHTLRQLLAARAALETVGLGADDLAFLMLSRVLDMCSRAQTDGIYKAPTSTKRADTPANAIQTVVAQVRHDALHSNVGLSAPAATIYQRSSEDMSDIASGTVDVAVTSPPYLNNFDFAEMTRMHLYFWGICGSWRDITDTVRARLVTNTTTALAGHRDRQVTYREGIPHSLVPQLDSIVAALGHERNSRAGRKEYHLLVYPYFAQLSRVLLEVQRCLAPRAPLHIVVADAAFYGIHVSTPQLLALAMADMGFVNVRCIKLRDRGHRWLLQKRDGSPIGLGEYHVAGDRAPVS